MAPQYKFPAIDILTDTLTALTVTEDMLIFVILGWSSVTSISCFIKPYPEAYVVHSLEHGLMIQDAPGHASVLTHVRLQLTQNTGLLPHVKAVQVFPAQ